MVHIKRPVNLNLWTIHFPVPAVVSILHRISGILLFLGLPFILYWWQKSLASFQAFEEVKYTFSTGVGARLFIWAMSSAFLYHALAGCRHLIMDVGRGKSLKAATYSAYIVLIGTALGVMILGGYLWL